MENDRPLSTTAVDEEKENHSPSPERISYPVLPPPPSPPAKSPLRGNGSESPLLGHNRARRPSNTSNTGRKRIALSALINSPARAGYAEQVRAVFSNPVSKLEPLRLTPRKPAWGRRDAQSLRELRPWSPLRSDSEGEREMRFPGSSSEGVSVADGVVGDGFESQHEVKEDEEGGIPLRPPALPYMPECPMQGGDDASPRTHQDIPCIREPPPSYNDSSDSWTGDEEFLPRSANRQKRIDRKLLESPQHLLHPSPSSQLLRPEAPAYTGANYPWPTALSKPSRFQAAPRIPAYPELPMPPSGTASDHRASDADDEDSNSS